MYQWLVLLHILGAFGFVLAHGASTFAALGLRKERDLDRVRALLDLSNGSQGAAFISLLVMAVRYLGCVHIWVVGELLAMGFRGALAGGYGRDVCDRPSLLQSSSQSRGPAIL